MLSHLYFLVTFYFALASAIVGFGFASDQIGIGTAKKSLGQWITSSMHGESLRWDIIIINLFDSIFGSKFWTLKRIMRSAFASLSIFLIMLIIWFLTHKTYGWAFIDHSNFYKRSLEIILAFTMCNIIGDFLSLQITRYILMHLKNVFNMFIILFFVLVDFLMSVTIILLIGILYIEHIQRVFFIPELPSIDYREFSSYVKSLKLIPLQPGYFPEGVVFYSSLLTSIWLWLIVPAKWFYKWVFPKGVGKLILKWIDINKYPMTFLCIIFNCLLGLIFLLIAGIVVIRNYILF